MGASNIFDEPVVESGQRMGTNLHAEATRCVTCGGDRFVIAAKRKPLTTVWMQEHGRKANEGHLLEEYAPCPDCNAKVVEQYRADGALIKTPDPAKVRDLLQR